MGLGKIGKIKAEIFFDFTEYYSQRKSTCQFTDFFREYVRWIAGDCDNTYPKRIKFEAVYFLKNLNTEISKYIYI